MNVSLKQKKNPQYFSLISEEGTNKIKIMPLNGCLLVFFVAMYVQRGNPPNIYICMALMAFSHQRAGFAEQKFFLL